MKNKLKYFLIPIAALLIFFLRQEKMSAPQSNSERAPIMNKSSILVPVQELPSARLKPEHLQSEIQLLEARLANYAGFSYDQFSEEQLAEFNLLVQKKAVLIKKNIFRKYGSVLMAKPRGNQL